MLMTMTANREPKNHVALYCVRFDGPKGVKSPSVVREFRELKVPKGSSAKKEIERIVAELSAALPGWEIKAVRMTAREFGIERQKLDAETES